MRGSSDTEQLAVNQQRAAHLLGVSVATLRRWAREGAGPDAIVMKGLVRYRRCDLEKFLERSRRQTEAEATPCLNPGRP